MSKCCPFSTSRLNVEWIEVEISFFEYQGLTTSLILSELDQSERKAARDQLRDLLTEW